MYVYVRVNYRSLPYQTDSFRINVLRQGQLRSGTKFRGGNITTTSVSPLSGSSGRAIYVRQEGENSSFGTQNYLPKGDYTLRKFYLSFHLGRVNVFPFQGLKGFNYW